MISFENVAKVYAEKSVAALDDVTLDIERGEFVYLVGASGSGKSTFLQLVLREQKATSGRVLVAGKDVAQLSSWKVPHLRRQMGAVFQDFRLLPNKTVHENVAFALEVLGRSRSSINQTVPQTLEMVGLAGKERRYPHQLSGGEQQRVAIARAFVNRPAILLADEPTGNLDPVTSRGIMRVLDRINGTGTTIVMATHDVALVDEIRRRVIELDAGHVIRDELGGTYVTTTSIPVIRVDEDEAVQVEAFIVDEDGDVAAVAEVVAAVQADQVPESVGTGDHDPAADGEPAWAGTEWADEDATWTQESPDGDAHARLDEVPDADPDTGLDEKTPRTRREMRELRARELARRQAQAEEAAAAELAAESAAGAAPSPDEVEAPALAGEVSSEEGADTTIEDDDHEDDEPVRPRRRRGFFGRHRSS